MKKTIYSKFDKNAINDLPVAEFEGRIIVVLNEQEAEKAVDYLLSCDILGMDTETRPAFQRGQSFKVALLQVSSRDTCFLFRLNLIGFCPAVKRLLEDTTVPKIGLSWHDDLRMLGKRGEFTPGLFFDIQNMVGEIGIKDLALQKLYANIFSKKISKKQRLTNWEAPILTDLQKAYAALDAQACIQLYEEINRLKATKDYDLIVIPEPEPPVPQHTDEPKEKKAKVKKKPRKPRKKKPAVKTENTEKTEKAAKPEKVAKDVKVVKAKKISKSANQQTTKL